MAACRVVVEAGQASACSFLQMEGHTHAVGTVDLKTMAASGAPPFDGPSVLSRPRAERGRCKNQRLYPSRRWLTLTRRGTIAASTSRGSQSIGGKKNGNPCKIPLTNQKFLYAGRSRRAPRQRAASRPTTSGRTPKIRLIRTEKSTASADQMSGGAPDVLRRGQSQKRRFDINDVH